MSAPAAPLEAAPPSFGERLGHWRRRIVANPRFQRWAAGFPLTRGIAERQSRALFDLCAGFVYSQALLACVRLDVFTKLAGGARSCRSLSGEIGLDIEATRRLLRAATALKLLDALPDDRFALADLGAALLGNPSIADFVEHHELLYADLADPVALLRGETMTRLAGFWPYASRRPGESPAPPDDQAEAYARFSRLMSRSQALIAEDVLEACAPRDGGCWLDVGGGEGAFVGALAARAPKLRLMMFDLPPVAALARTALAARGLGGRVEVIDGDFLAGPLPEGAETLSLVRVLHDHDDESARALLRRAHAALPPGGQIVIAEPMAATPGAEAVGDAYFGFYLLAMGRGRPRSAHEILRLLVAAGFGRGRAVKTRRPLLASVVTAMCVKSS